MTQRATTDRPTDRPTEETRARGLNTHDTTDSTRIVALGDARARACMYVCMTMYDSHDSRRRFPTT